MIDYNSYTWYQYVQQPRAPTRPQGEIELLLWELGAYIYVTLLTAIKFKSKNNTHRLDNNWGQTCMIETAVRIYVWVKQLYAYMYEWNSCTHIWLHHMTIVWCDLTRDHFVQHGWLTKPRRPSWLNWFIWDNVVIVQPFRVEGRGDNLPLLAVTQDGFVMIVATRGQPQCLCCSTPGVAHHKRRDWMVTKPTDSSTLS